MARTCAEWSSRGLEDDIQVPIRPYHHTIWVTCHHNEHNDTASIIGKIEVKYCIMCFNDLTEKFEAFVSITQGQHY